MPENDHPRGLRWIRSVIGAKTLLTIATIAALGSIGVFATQATFTDQTTMAQISVTGGSLDMVANSDASDGGVAWSGSLSVALTGLQPGDENSGTVEIDNTGDLPFTLTGTTTGADASGCFAYYFRETSVTGGTGAGSFPVNFAGMGTAAGADATMAPFATGVTAEQLPDVGVDNDWEVDDSKIYTVTVRMNSSCATNAANGTLDFTFDATQV